MITDALNMSSNLHFKIYSWLFLFHFSPKSYLNLSDSNKPENLLPAGVENVETSSVDLYMDN